MTDEEIIAVVTAHREGKTIKCTPRGGGNWIETFVDRKPINWNFHLFDYFVEPRKPREWSVAVGNEALWLEKAIVGNVEMIRVREILENEQ